MYVVILKIMRLFCSIKFVFNKNILMNTNCIESHTITMLFSKRKKKNDTLLLNCPDNKSSYKIVIQNFI